MKSCEALITPDSDYYLYSPSAGALEMFFYPICSGHFTYLPGYRLERSSYDSFLLMYVTDGSLTRETGATLTVPLQGLTIRRSFPARETYSVFQIRLRL